jgi:TRAP-type mannitol/chloroaromatic compound transport system permease small subunit
LLLLLPFVAVILWFALPYVGRSWALLERSRETSGLPFVYLLKTVIPLFAVLLGLQGISQAIRAARVLGHAHVASERRGADAPR